MTEELNYKAAFEELSQIAEDMESETISVDELSEKVKRAAVLIVFCQTKLSSTEAEVKKILTQMEKKERSKE
jgi:exodeoxyribonuclease VII small subunit